MIDVIEGGGMNLRDADALRWMQTGTRIARELRAIKSAAEIGFLRQAVGLAEHGIAAVRDAVAPGVSRREDCILSQRRDTIDDLAARQLGAPRMSRFAAGNGIPLAGC